MSHRHHRVGHSKGTVRPSLGIQSDLTLITLQQSCPKGPPLSVAGPTGMHEARPLSTEILLPCSLAGNFGQLFGMKNLNDFVRLRVDENCPVVYHCVAISHVRHLAEFNCVR
jgi:hypothetical protein